MALKLLQTLVLVALPPVSLAWLAFAAVLLSGRYRRVGRAVALISLALLLVLAMPLTGKALLASLGRGLPLTPQAASPPAAIVILGGNVAHSDLTFPPTGVGSLTLERLQAGAELYRRTKLPVLVSGGTLRRTTVPLAVLMEQSLGRDFEVPVRWMEPDSLDTWENAERSTAILESQGIRSIYLVTHAWHMRRAIIAFTHFGMSVTAAPVRSDPMPALAAYELIPVTTAWLASYYGIHEWVGCAYYTLR